MLEIMLAGVCGASVAVLILGALYLDRRRRLHLEWQKAHRAEIEQAERLRLALMAMGENLIQTQAIYQRIGERLMGSLAQPFAAFRALMDRVPDEVRELGETELEWWHRHIGEVKAGRRGG